MKKLIAYRGEEHQGAEEGDGHAGGHPHGEPEAQEEAEDQQHQEQAGAGVAEQRAEALVEGGRLVVERDQLDAVG